MYMIQGSEKKKRTLISCPEGYELHAEAVQLLLLDWSVHLHVYVQIRVLQTSAELS